jgi:hypothetical protein
MATNSSPPYRADRSYGSKTGHQHRGHALEDEVAGGVPATVVDELEVIDVDHEKRERSPFQLGTADLGLEPRHEEASVVQVGQAVAHGHLVQRPPGGLDLFEESHGAMADDGRHEQGDDHGYGQVHRLRPRGVEHRSGDQRERDGQHDRCNCEEHHRPALAHAQKHTTPAPQAHRARADRWLLSVRLRASAMDPGAGRLIRLPTYRPAAGVPDHGRLKPPMPPKINEIVAARR